MQQSGFHLLDLFVVAMLGSSGFLAYKRGLVKEVLALGSWVLAGVLTVVFYPVAKPLVNAHISNEMAADAATSIGLFCLTIIMLAPISNYLTGLVKGPTMSSIDHSLGFVFGVVRAFVILSLVYLCLTWIWPTDRDDHRLQPNWITEARTGPLLAYGADLLKSLAPLVNGDGAQEAIRKTREEAQEKIDDATRLEKLSTPTPAGHVRETPDANYGGDSRERLNTLIEQKAAP